MDWSYKSKPKHVTLGMPKYIPNALIKLQYTPLSKPEYAPAQHIIPAYSAKIQYVQPEDTNENKLSDESVKYIQKVVGIFLYYAYALDNTALMALSDLASEQ